MKVIVPPITSPVLLTDYHPAMLAPGTDKPVVVHVWVNPPRDIIAEHYRLVDEWKAAQDAFIVAAGDEAVAKERARMAAAEDGLAAWYARLWSMAADMSTHWTVEDVQALAALETDPALYSWLTRTSWELIYAHRATRKKVSASR